MDLNTVSELGAIKSLGLDIKYCHRLMLLMIYPAFYGKPDSSLSHIDAYMFFCDASRLDDVELEVYI